MEEKFGGTSLKAGILAGNSHMNSGQNLVLFQSFPVATRDPLNTACLSILSSAHSSGSNIII